jgi:hypothetical protein
MYIKPVHTGTSLWNNRWPAMLPAGCRRKHLARAGLAQVLL